MVGYLVGTGHFDRGRTGRRSLSKIPTINTTLSSLRPIAPRPDLDLIDDTYSHISRLHESSRQPSSTTFFDAPASPAPICTPTPHPIHPHHPGLLLTFRATRWSSVRYASFCISSSQTHFVFLYLRETMDDFDITTIKRGMMGRRWSMP